MEKPTNTYRPQRQLAQIYSPIAKAERFAVLRLTFCRLELVWGSLCPGAALLEEKRSLMHAF
jgi:hypothetical protein